MKKKYIGILFITTLFLLNIPILAAPCEHGIFTQGDGTATSPWKLSTPEQVDHIREHISNHFEFTNNINMFDSYSRTWKRIVNFNGVIDGKGFTLSGLGINDSFSRMYNIRGFIGTLRGTIKNLNFSEIYVYPDNDPQDADGGPEIFGAIAAINNGTILNCNLLSGKVFTFETTAGGLAGHNNGTIKYSTNYARVDSDYTAGGIVAGNGGRIMYCSNYGEIGSRATPDVGGISGVNSGKVIGCSNFGIVTARATGGGIVGILQPNGLIKDSYTAGSSGCITGLYWGWDGFIENCYNVEGFMKGTDSTYISKPGKHTITNSYVGSSKPTGEQEPDIWFRSDEFMKSQEFVDLLNAGREPAVWVKGDKDYPYPQIIGEVKNSINIEHTRIGDNTDLVIQTNITTPLAIWELVDVKTGKVFATGEPLSDYNQTFRFPLEGFNGDLKLVSRIRKNSKILHQSPIYLINKVHALNYSVSALLNENGMPKILLINDTDRYFENNIANQQLVQEIKKRSTGKILIYNTVSPVLQPLIER